jgi:hypothetical protein
MFIHISITKCNEMHVCMKMKTYVLFIFQSKNMRMGDIRSVVKTIEQKVVRL